MPQSVRKAIGWTLLVPLLTNLYLLYHAVEGQQSGLLQTALYLSVLALGAAVLTLMGIVPYRSTRQKPVDMPKELEDYD